MEFVSEYATCFVNWTKLKIKLHFLKKKRIYFHEREIWWASIGVNIGFEQDGKHDSFERPVIIIRKFNHDFLWAIPLTTKEKTGKYYFRFEYNNQIFFAILSQLRAISSRRLIRKIRTISKDDFEKIKHNIKSLI